MDYNRLTVAQRAAVDQRGSILVSAAAGSGKTAVLVERIIKELTDEKSSLSADRILVVTFTNAAAAEMRARLEKGIDEYCRNHPDNKNAFKQRLLIQSADICTIDSYCISMVRDNFHKLDINADFSIIESNDLETIKSKATTEVFEKYFRENDPVFIRLLDAFGSLYDESDVIRAVKDIYEVSRNMPFPDVWLEDMKKRYGDGSFNIWRDAALSRVQKYLEIALKYSLYADNLLNSDEKLKSCYFPAFDSDRKKVNLILEAIANKDWDKVYTYFSNFKYEGLTTYKGEAKSDADTLKAIREIFKSFIEKASKFVYDCEETVKAHYCDNAPLSLLLFTLTQEFSSVIERMLKEKGTFSFNDIEHMAFELICEYKDGQVVLKDDAQEYISGYDEIFVDEYQDVNDLQDKFFYFLSDMGKKLFAVGDVKQSIYGFRGANPENFLARQNTSVPYLEASEADTKLINLDANFRSRKEICDSINFIFDRIMTEEFCSINYKAERLVGKAEFPEVLTAVSEAHIVDASGFKEKEAEAMHIADYIVSVMNSGKVIRDKTTGKLRNAKYSDFAIIVRYLKNNAEAIAKEFKKRGIPVSYSKEGFLNTKEIKLIMSFLTVIDNPTNEIELLSVLMSPFFCFTPDDMADIRIGDKKSNLYSALILKAKKGDEKCQDFIEFFSSLRKSAAVMPLSKLISLIYDKTGFYNMMSLLNDSQARIANLNHFLKLAADFEAAGYHGISAFKRNLERIGDGKLKGGAVNAGNDSVKLMTIHYSKGLQFPICIVAFAGSPFNASDQKKSLIIDTKHGISFKFYSDEGGIVPIDKMMLSAYSKDNQLKEELRMLYVAATRAEDRLVFVMTKKNPYSYLKKTAVKLQVSNGAISEDIYSETSNYGDWIIPCLLMHPDSDELRAVSGITTPPHTAKGRFHSGIYKVSYANEDIAFEKFEPDENVASKIKERIEYKYPFEQLRYIESKSSVSVMAHKAEQGEFDFTMRPAFMNSSGLTPTLRGTAVHKIMQYMDFDGIRKDFEAEIQRLIEWEYITEAEANADTSHIKTFIKSNLFERMCASKDLRREMKFLTYMPVTKVQPDIAEHLKNEQIIVQGAVDCMFEEDGKIVIVDFKTDRVKNEEALISSYAEQLNIYAGACEKITGLRVKEKIIYSLVLDRCIML